MTTLDALGSNLCLVGNLDTFRIDIVVSEHGKIEKKKGKSKGKRGLLIGKCRFNMECFFL